MYFSKNKKMAAFEREICHSFSEYDSHLKSDILIKRATERKFAHKSESMFHGKSHETYISVKTCGS